MEYQTIYKTNLTKQKILLNWVPGCDEDEDAVEAVDEVDAWRFLQALRPAPLLDGVEARSCLYFT